MARRDRSIELCVPKLVVQYVSKLVNSDSQCRLTNSQEMSQILSGFVNFN